MGYCQTGKYSYLQIRNAHIQTHAFIFQILKYEWSNFCTSKHTNSCHGSAFKSTTIYQVDGYITDTTLQPTREHGGINETWDWGIRRVT